MKVIAMLTPLVLLAGEAAQSGADTLYGGAGSDWLLGGGGDYYLDGGTENDVLFGEGGGATHAGDGGGWRRKTGGKPMSIWATIPQGQSWA